MPRLWAVWSVLVPAEHSTFFISASGMVGPQDRNNYWVKCLRFFNFDFWFVALALSQLAEGSGQGLQLPLHHQLLQPPKGGRARGEPRVGPQAVWGPAGVALALLHPSLPTGDQGQLPPGLSSHEQQLMDMTCSQTGPGNTKFLR